MLCDLLPAHAKDALVRKTPLTNPCRNNGNRSKKFSIGRENQSTRIEALSKLTDAECDCHVRLGSSSHTWQGNPHETIAETAGESLALCTPAP